MLNTEHWMLEHNDFGQSRSRAELQSLAEDMSRLTHPMDTVRARGRELLASFDKWPDRRTKWRITSENRPRDAG